MEGGREGERESERERGLKVIEVWTVTVNNNFEEYRMLQRLPFHVDPNTLNPLPHFQKGSIITWGWGGI